MISVSIIIVNWNARTLLADCVDALLASKSSNFEIIIIDNNSSDNSIDILTNSSKINIIKNGLNKGFGYACNQGIRQAQGDYLLILNPDVKVEPDTLMDACTYLDKHTDISILGVAHYDDNKTIKASCSRFATPLNIAYDVLGLSKLLPQFFKNSSLMLDWNHKNSRAVDQVMGAFMLLKKEIVQTVGLFDERFFVYYEDMDFCKRAGDLGYKVFYNYDIKIFHKGMGTTEGIKDKRLAYSLESRLKYIHKHFSLLSYIFVLLLSFLIEPFSRAFFLLLKGKFSEIPAILRGYVFLIKRLLLAFR